MRIVTAPDGQLPQQIGVRKEGFPSHTQVQGQTPVDLVRVVDERVDDGEACVLELARALNEFGEPSEQEIGDVIPGIAGRLGEIEAPLGTEVVDDVDRFLLGRFSEFIQGAGEFKNTRFTIVNAFVNDSYKVNRRLTLDLGMRWEPFFLTPICWGSWPSGAVTMRTPRGSSMRPPRLRVYSLSIVLLSNILVQPGLISFILISRNFNNLFASLYYYEWDNKYILLEKQRI